MLEHPHESHQDSMHTKQQARLTVFWPGLDNNINNVLLACKKFKDTFPSNTKEQIVSKPTLLFQEIAVDFCFHTVQDYLVLVDWCSNWANIIPMGHDTTDSHCISIETCHPTIVAFPQHRNSTVDQFRTHCQLITNHYQMKASI